MGVPKYTDSSLFKLKTGFSLFMAGIFLPLMVFAQQPVVNGLDGALRESMNDAGDPAEVAGVRLSVPDSVLAFYANRKFQPAWISDDGFGRNPRALLALLNTAVDHGLKPSRYHLDRIMALDSDSPGRTSRNRQAEIDILLSDALLAFAADLLYGRPVRADLKDSSIDGQESLDFSQTVATALASGRLDTLINALAPQSAAYERLRAALPRLRERAAAELPYKAPQRKLRHGDHGADITALRRRLELLGDLPEDAGVESTVFNLFMDKAVRRFQYRHGLKVDGIVGPNTAAALGKSLRWRLRQAELSLARWRWLPRNPGERYVVVNIAGQELDVVENGQSTMNMRVIVGKPFQQTPSFSSMIDLVTLNPYWNVPYSIATEEILPLLRGDSGYLARQGMQVLERSGKIIDAGVIDWNSLSERDFPYQFRQDPGPDNALGQVKFLMPNAHSVYLHDTPARALFSGSARQLSHGCVRLEKPLEFANLLLHDEPGWALERIEKTLQTHENYRVRLTTPMPVYLVYWTAWVDADGEVHFRDDIYGLDGRLQSALNLGPWQKPTEAHN